MTALVLVACGKPTPEEALAQAQAQLASFKPKDAVLLLKDSLQRHEQWGDGRLALGEALLAAGDPVAAELELRKAAELGVAPERVVPPLARTLIERKRFADVLGSFGASTKLESADAKADLHTSLAIAHAALGDEAGAERALQAALSAKPDHPYALLTQARRLAAANQLTPALERVATVLAHAESPAAWTLQGDLLAFGKEDHPAARAAYERALLLQPDHLPAHSGIVQSLLARREPEAAERQVERLAELRPGQVQTQYLRAQTAYALGHYEQTLELTQQLLGKAPAEPRLLLLAGASELQLGRLRDAELQLKKVLNAAPSTRAARLLLAQVHLKDGNAAEALAVLQPLQASKTPDVELLLLSARARMLDGQTAQALALYDQAVQLDAHNVRSRTARALARLATRDEQRGFEELTLIAGEDRGPLADLALYSARMARQDARGALAAAQSLEAKQPREALPAHLRGVAELQAGDRPAARRSFERALSFDAAYMPALNYLAALDLDEGQPERARQRYQAVLDAHPGHQQATLALADFQTRLQAPADEIARLLEGAAATPGAVRVQERLIELHLAARNLPAALAAAQAAVSAAPHQPTLLDLLGRVQWQSGDLLQAQATFSRLKTAAPSSPVAHVRLADLSMARKDPDAAEQHLRHALELAPELPIAQRNLVALLAGSGRHPEALRLARELQARSPRASAGYLFEGDVAAAQKNWGAAVAAYERGMKAAPDATLAVQLHAALTQLGKAPAASALEQRWLGEHPKDVAFLLHLGRTAVARQDHAAAKRHFTTIAELRPEDPVALIHLAYSMNRLGQSGALMHARKAVQLAPDQPPLMSTYIESLVLAGEQREAVTVAQRLVELRPDSPEHRLVLARLLLKSGDSAAARTELQTIVDQHGDFAQIGEVRALLAQR